MGYVSDAQRACTWEGQGANEGHAKVVELILTTARLTGGEDVAARIVNQGNDSEDAVSALLWLLGWLVVGLLVIVLLSVGIYSFVLAPEDTTADLYKPVESIDPLKKSLTGVGHKSELPSESKKLKRLEGTGNVSDEEEKEDDDEDYEDELDYEEDDSDFDERKILDELTGTHSIGSQPDKEDEESDEDGKSIAAAPVKKRAVKKRVAKKGVPKKVVKRPSTRTDTNQPEMTVPKGMISAKCPSCGKTHNVDENTTKFICSCGRRIRV